MSNIDVTNPGCTNVVTQGDGLTSVNQPVTVSPSSNAGSITQGGSYAPGLGTEKPDQPVTVTPSMTAQKSVDGGTASPTSPHTINTTENTVVNQVYGSATPAVVYV